MKFRESLIPVRRRRAVRHASAKAAACGTRLLGRGQPFTAASCLCAAALPAVGAFGQPPPVNIPAAATSQTGASAAERPLSLADSIAIALHEGQVARAARFERDSARTDADRQRPRIQPTVNLRTDLVYQGPGDTIMTRAGDSFLYLPDRTGQLDVVMIQPIYQPGYDAAKMRYSAQVRVVESNYRKELVAIALGVNRAYLDVIKAQSGVATAQDGLKSAETYQALVSQQIAAGQAKPVDMQTVSAQVAEATAGLSKAESGLRLARMAFNKALSRTLDMPVTLEAPGPLPIVPDSPAGAVALALRNRPEMVTLEQLLKAAKAGVPLALSQRYPNLSVRGEVSEQSPTAFVNSTYAGVTFELKWSLLDAGKSEQDIKQAHDAVSRLEALLSDARAGIELDVTQSWEKMREARSQLELAGQVVQAREATELVTEKAYEVGRATVYEVENAQKDVRSARESELDADYDLRSAGVEFQYAQGLGLPTVSPAGPIPREPRPRRERLPSTSAGEKQP